MSAKRLVPLRHRGTEEQRYARLQKAQRRGSPLPRVGINYHDLWLRRWKREKRRPLSEFVDVAITLLPGDAPDPFSTAVFDVLRSTERVPYIDNSINVVKHALRSALAETGHTDVAVACT